VIFVLATKRCKIRVDSSMKTAPYMAVHTKPLCPRPGLKAKGFTANYLEIH